MNWYIWTAKDVVDKKWLKKIFLDYIRDNNIKIWDITLENIWDIKINAKNMMLFYSVVVSTLLDFYWCQLREFHDIEYIKTKYWLSQWNIDFVKQYWNVEQAIIEHNKWYVWENSKAPVIKEHLNIIKSWWNLDKQAEQFVINNAKKRIWELTVELLDVKTEKEKKIIEKDIKKLKSLL